MIPEKAKKEYIIFKQLIQVDIYKLHACVWISTNILSFLNAAHFLLLCFLLYSHMLVLYILSDVNNVCLSEADIY